MSRFEELIAPLDADGFFEGCYAREFFISRERGDRFAKYLDWTAFNALLERLTVESRNKIAFSRQGHTDHNPDDIWLGNGDAAITEIARKLRAGHTLIYNSIDQDFNALRELANDMEVIFREEVNFNCYVSMKPEVGFGLHWDEHDVFAMQLEGRKYWALYGFTDCAPLKHGDCQPPPRTAKPVWEGYLEEGDCLYLPRGMWHCAVSTGAPSMHLTCGIKGLKPLDILKWITALAKDDRVIRQNLHPAYMSHSDKSGVIEYMREWLLEQLDGNAIDRFWLDRKMHSAPRQKANFPDMFSTSLSDIRNCDLFYFGPLDPEIWQGRHGHFTVIAGREFKLEEDFVEAFQDLSSRSKTPGRRLRDLIPGSKTDRDVQAFIRTLEQGAVLSVGGSLALDRDNVDELEQ